MKRKLLLGMAFVVTALLLFSCNKNRFDLTRVYNISDKFHIEFYH